jgi:hypothetical protein
LPGNVFSFNEIQVSLTHSRLFLTLSSSIVLLNSDKYNLLIADLTLDLASTFQSKADVINLLIIISSGVSV